MNKKVVLIPGWMAGDEMYRTKYEILEVWRNKILPEIKIEADWIVTHSLGGQYLLSNPNNWEGKKIILASPLILKKSIFTWFLRWIKFHLSEKPPKKREFILGFDQIIFGQKMVWKLLRLDMKKVLSQIPKENIFIVYGEKDIFFFGEESLRLAIELGIKTFSVEAGHYWNDAIAKKVDEIIANN
jgi:hypothetical protein